MAVKFTNHTLFYDTLNKITDVDERNTFISNVHKVMINSQSLAKFSYFYVNENIRHPDVQYRYYIQKFLNSSKASSHIASCIVLNKGPLLLAYKLYNYDHVKFTGITNKILSELSNKEIIKNKYYDLLQDYNKINELHNNTSIPVNINEFTEEFFNINRIVLIMFVSYLIDKEQYIDSYNVHDMMSKRKIRIKN